MCVPQRQKSKSPLRFLLLKNSGGKPHDKMTSSSISSPLTNQINLIIKNKKIQQTDSLELNLIELFMLCVQLFSCFLSNKNRQFPSFKYYLALFFICLLSYSTALNPNSEFVHDDLVAIVRNPDVFNSPIKNLFLNDFWGTRMDTPTSHKSYRPFTVLTFRINMQISKFWLKKSSSIPDHYQLEEKFDNYSDQPDEQELHRFAWTFRLVNVLLHAFATQLFAYILINNFLIDIKYAFIASIHFSLHPIHTEAVSSIVGRADILAAIFMMITFNIYKRMLKSYKTGRMLDGFYFTCTSILALLSKETGITILPICIGHFIYKFYFIQQVISSKNRPSTLKQTYQSKSSSKPYIHKFIKILNRNCPLILSTVLLICLLSFRIWMLNGQLPIFTNQDNPAAFSSSLLTRFLTFAYLAAFSFTMFLMPSKLSYDWQMNSIPLVEQMTDLRNLTTISVFFVLFGLIFSSIRNRNKNFESIFYFGITFLILPHIPASNLLVTVGFVIAERTLYIPSIGFSTLFIIAYIQLKNYLKCQTHLTKHQKANRKHYLKTTIYIMFAIFFIKTLVRNQDWLTRESLFKSGLRDLPQNAKIQYNYANLQKDLGRVEIAIHHYRLALSYWPNHESAHNNLAVLLDDLNEAEKHLLKTLDLNPFHSKAYFNLANIHSKRGDHQYSISLLKKAIKLNPELGEAYSKLGTEYANKKEFKIAKEYHQYALKLQPRNADFLNNYGAFLYQSGKTEQAFEMYKKALRYNYHHKKARENLDQIIKQSTNL